MLAKKITLTIYGEDEDDLSDMISDVAERLCTGDVKGNLDADKQGYKFEMLDTEPPEYDYSCNSCAGTGECQYDGGSCFIFGGSGMTQSSHHHQHH